MKKIRVIVEEAGHKQVFEFEAEHFQLQTSQTVCWASKHGEDPVDLLSGPVKATKYTLEFTCPTE